MADEIARLELQQKQLGEKVDQQPQEQKQGLDDSPRRRQRITAAAAAAEAEASATSARLDNLLNRRAGTAEALAAASAVDANSSAAVQVLTDAVLTEKLKRSLANASGASSKQKSGGAQFKDGDMKDLRQHIANSQEPAAETAAAVAAAAVPANETVKKVHPLIPQDLLQSATSLSRAVAFEKLGRIVIQYANDGGSGS